MEVQSTFLRLSSRSMVSKFYVASQICISHEEAHFGQPDILQFYSMMRTLISGPLVFSERMSVERRHPH